MKYIFLLLLLNFSAFAHDNHYINTSISENYTAVKSGSLALAMAAAGAKPYGGTASTQIVASGGYMNDEWAGIIGIAKRFCIDCPLIQLNLGRADDKTGYSASFLWILK